MDEQRRLRTRFEKKLNLPRGAGGPVWEELEKKGLVADVMDGQALFQDLLDEAKDSPEYWKAVRARKLPPGRKPQKIREHYEVELGEYENERAAALSDVLAQKAAMHAAVVRFRKEILGGRLLGPDEAHAFVTSPAVRFFWRPWFKEWGIPLLRHDAKIVSQDEDHHELGLDVLRSGFRPGTDRYVSVLVDPPGVTKSVLHGPPTIRVPAGLDVDKRYLGHEEHDGIAVESPEPVFRFPSNGATRKVRALPGSLLSELHDLSDLLVDLYGWRREQAGWFVLTGETPRIEPIAVSASLLTGYRRIAPVWTVSLEVAPWLDAKEVTRIYREIQKQILLGDNSRVKVRNLAILRFVAAQTAAQGKRPTWRTLLERWNETYPEQHEWHYGNGKEPDRHVWNFRRDYDRAKKAVLSPDHHFPRRRAKSRLEDWAQQDLEKRRIAAERFIDDVIETLGDVEHPYD